MTTLSTSSNTGPAKAETSAADKSFLQIQDLVKEFDGYQAVSHASVDIAKGEIFALLGPSGCGKSTLLRMLAGFETPTSGRVVLDGVDLAGLPPYERPMNMMFQSYALFPHLTVWDNIAFGLKREGLPKAQTAERVQSLLKLVQLERFAQRKPHQLSGGQQQRVALARSLARQPRLLLLDEPLGALDKKLREQTQLELVNIIEQVGVTCVMVTHDQEEAMTMASRLAVMNEGRFLQIGAPNEIYESPSSRFVADFIGNVNLIDGRVTEDEPDHVIIDTADGRHYVGHGISGTLGMAVTVALRPEKIHLSRRRTEDDFNNVRGRIKEMAYFGSFTVYHLTLASGALLKVSMANTQRHRDEELTWGDEAWAHWSRSAPVVLTQ
jgi:putrescine transport system ATP-binding protein